ncbi:hypothetical protein [Sphingomonas sp.]|uniref:hypothetical protein n=1 Tax=Sphingomonas sp. TaxID=28214 RepID=UPI003B3B3EAC
MTRTEEQSYFAQCAQQCLMLAERAIDPSARNAHLRLAELYARRAEAALKTDPYRPALR